MYKSSVLQKKSHGYQHCGCTMTFFLILLVSAKYGRSGWSGPLNKKSNWDGLMAFIIEMITTTNWDTFSNMQMTMTGIMRKRNSLRYQVLHSTHCFKPIISIVSRIRLSFSTTSSYSNVQQIMFYCHTHSNTPTKQAPSLVESKPSPIH